MADPMFDLGIRRTQWGSGGGLSNAVLDLGLDGTGETEEEKRKKKRLNGVPSAVDDLFGMGRGLAASPFGPGF